MLSPASKPGKGKCTTAAVLLDIIKDVEIAISCRKGRTRTAASDVAFPKAVADPRIYFTRDVNKIIIIFFYNKIINIF
jgi:hypothetical protein